MTLYPPPATPSAAQSRISIGPVVSSGGEVRVTATGAYTLTVRSGTRAEGGAWNFSPPLVGLSVTVAVPAGHIWIEVTAETVCIDRVELL